MSCGPIWCLSVGKLVAQGLQGCCNTKITILMQLILQRGICFGRQKKGEGQEEEEEEEEEEHQYQ